jgi:hypothetical protein
MYLPSSLLELYSPVADRLSVVIKDALHKKKQLPELWRIPN